MATDCPTEVVLAHFVKDRLSAAQDAAVDAHVETCLACQEVLTRLRLGSSQLARWGATLPGLGRIDSLSLPSVPGYEVLGELGRGGMGVVYKARQRSLDRIVALKMILAGARSDPEHRARMRREAELVARVQHPNVVQIHKVGEHEGHTFLALEFVDGPTLAAHCNRAPQSPRWAAAVVETVARAVDHAHRKGVIHRDLKPGNVLLAAGADPKVTDFGLARPAEDGPRLTTSHAVVGTPSYMAPEQAAGPSAEVGPSADVYGLGAILYELLTGRPPFQGATQFDTLQQVVGADPAPARQFQPAVPRDLETVCHKCLHKDARRRYPDAAALAEDLRRFLAGEAIRARPVGPLERAWKWGRRHPAAAALAGALALGGVTAVGLAVWALGERDAAVVARGQAVEQRRKAERQAVLTLYQQALFRCETEGAPRGVLWLARSVKEAAGVGATDLEELAREQLGPWISDCHSLRHVLAHGGQVAAVAWSPDGRAVLTGGDDKAARLWDAKTGRPLATLPHPGKVHAVAFSPDGKTVATGSNFASPQLWDAATGNPLGLPLRYQDKVLSVAFSPDGRTLAAGAHDGTVRLWDVASRRETVALKGHAGGVQCLAFSRDGATVLTGSSDATARLWNAVTGQCLGELKHATAVWGVAFSPDGKAVLTTDGDAACLWDAASGRPLGLRLRHQNEVRAVAFSPDGQTVLTASADYTARLWDATTGEPLGPALQHQDKVVAAAFAPDGRAVVTGSLDTQARLWEAERAGSPALTLPHGGFVQAVAFSPDGQTVLTGSLDNTAQLWDAATGRRLGEPLPHQGWVQAVAFSPDGRTVATGGVEPTVWLWDAATGKRLRGLPHPQRVWGVAFSPDGKTILTGSADNAARLWEADTGKPLPLRLRHANQVTSVAFSPYGKTALTGSWDGTAQAWDVGDGRAVGPPLRHKNEVQAVAFSRDGKTILTGSRDGTARLWEAATGSPLGLPLQHPGLVWAVAFSPDGRAVLIGGQKTARLWDVAAHQPVGPPLHHQGLVEAVAFSPDGRRVLTGGQDNVARLWEVSPAVQGDPERIILRTEVITGMELDEQGGVRVLDAAAWRDRKERLGE